MKMRISIFVLILAPSLIARAGDIVRVTGLVVDAAGKPVAGARVAEFWGAEDAAPLEPTRPESTGMEGRFSLELELYKRDTVVTAVDATDKLGGIATVSAKSPLEPVKITLAPMVEIRGRYASEKAGQSLNDTWVTVLLSESKLRVATRRLRTPTFAFRLPPGRYILSGDEGGPRHLNDEREFSLETGKDVDLGEIKLQLSTIAQLYGKPAPSWHITDARGVSKDVQPADFKGKWVVLEFWGYWCGPCVSRGLPGWISFVDDHSIDRDKFVVLAVHDPQATDFAMLDEKLKPIIRRAWRGRELPFPILLDASGAMKNDYGVDGWPTAVLIDPEGRVVDVPFKPLVLGNWACEEYLASKLTPLPPAKQIAGALDRGLALAVDDDEALAQRIKFYETVGNFAIRLDQDELKAAGIDDQVRIPFTLSGTLTLRAWLNLTLEPFGLTYVEDGVGLRIVRRTPENGGLSQPSPRQVAENALVAAALEEKATLELQGKSLPELLSVLEAKTGESFVLDPVARRSGAIKSNFRVSGSAVDEPLSSVLTRLLTPLGMKYVVRNEAVVLKTIR